MKEIWKDIKDYEELYQVSNLGRVRSMPRKGTHINKIHILKSNKNYKGYLHVSLTKKCVSKTKSIHRLVAETFIPNPDNLPQVNHKDGNKLNNCVDNLEWITNYDNLIHSIRIGLRKNSYKKGKDHCRSVIVNQYDLNNNFIKQWYCVKDIERELGYDNRNICACCRNKRPTAYGYIWKYN